MMTIEIADLAECLRSACLNRLKFRNQKSPFLEIIALNGPVEDVAHCTLLLCILDRCDIRILRHNGKSLQLFPGRALVSRGAALLSSSIEIHRPRNAGRS